MSFTARRLEPASCRGTPRKASTLHAGWLGLLALTPTWTLTAWPPWLVMVCIAVTMMAVLKTVSLIQFAHATRIRLRLSDLGAWYLLWPGLEPRDFFVRPHERISCVTWREWMVASLKALAGIALIKVIAPIFIRIQPLLAGWIVIAGLLLVFHFGGFHVLALIWRSRGRTVRPIMNQPFLATSVADFWGNRWNLAFRDFTSRFVMRPLARRWNGTVALWGCYLFSAVVHELAISVPAGGGYGLPAAYFLIQGCGAAFERTAVARSFILWRPWISRLWAWLVICPAAVILFHPPFLLRVILPLVGLFEVQP